VSRADDNDIEYVYDTDMQEEAGKDAGKDAGAAGGPST
jgi:hypothetical protein